MLKNNKYLFLIPAISGILFLVIAFSYSTSFWQAIDLGALQFMIDNTTVVITIFFEVITMLASWKGILVVLIFIFVFSKNKMDFVISAGMGGLTYLISSWVKSIAERPRPDAIQLSAETGFSFPSNHTAVAVVFYGVIAFLIWQKMKSKNTKILVTVFISLLVILIGISRIYLRVHYVTDVLAGLLLGITILSLFYIGYFNLKPYLEKAFPKRKEPKRRQVTPKASEM